MSEPGAKVVRGLIEALLLVSLSRGPKHGYAMLKEIEDMAGEAPNRNKLYPLLARLEAQGLVAREATDATGAARGRTQFSLTPEGRLELDRLRRLPDPLRSALRELWGEGAVAAPVVAPDHAGQTSPPRPVAGAFAPIAASPPQIPAGQLPYPCPEARVHLEKDPRTGALAIRLAGCPMGAYAYCPDCPVYKGVEGMRRLLLG